MNNKGNEAKTNYFYKILKTIREYIIQQLNDLLRWLFGEMIQNECIENNIEIFDDEDILDLDCIPRGSEKFLNQYDQDELADKMLKYKVKYGPNSGSSIKEVLERKGINNLKIEFDTSDYYVHKAQLFNEKKDSNHLIGQLFLRVNNKFNIVNCKRVVMPNFFENAFKEGVYFMEQKLSKTELNLTIIEWLRLQDYRIEPKDGTLMLPGQIHPGLGIGHEIEEMLMDFISRKGRDGPLNTPEHWYNAYLYYMRSHFHFLNPAFEGLFRSINASIKKDIEEHRLTGVAWAIAQGKLYHRPTKEQIIWVALEQVYPLSRRMKNYFGQEYTEIVMRNYHPKDYFIDWDDTLTK
ncbi:hypothetical protein EHI8A_057830 [Entamoeba histolytica HM-1:IMSS-B]|uniref:Uncharacterized protein n=5 Tax=Entamoeba histolytica TaxID=5759 RepID=C4LT59_ENTH1|nr:hypothetical protein EHI_148920 [Entamoeba histolytica HM-1:IMSS]EMD46494.1 Hypothetical protein EHI5A_037860 [Entamoeba histolytica KU27]EMH74102.1 hypothetical protein EHI8A_057830 [Entamoeba histolytica HM-1:IMSS-B]ENY63280.1 hypothetical protein EHI7A_050650 [Entamoeba histolytica HM-1:IMSS-A]GAT91732.1 hypothetical protein CL6EHI_148920 [Entamoeba histolytica]EAL52197.2 hypothetical protein EHI_148920 [Entamoeba histolytica HM-1:IMSS]|eukprot:XP_657574.2 hypothetical protein EHI_148920 [Entamoeba histolytica HM-1:IMSS]